MILNLTPHPVTVGTVTIPPADAPFPRVEEHTTTTTPLLYDGVEIPVVQVSLGQVSNLPAPRDGITIIVSRMVAEAAPHRTDLLVPVGQVRDSAGRIVGCTALGRIGGTR